MLRGNARLVVGLCAVAMALGCEQPAEQYAPLELPGPSVQTDVFATDPALAVAGPDDTSYAEPVAPGEGSSVDAAAPANSVHIVARGDTLFSLARQYYGQASRWRDIYEANRALVTDPNRIFVGQELVIP